MRYIDADILKKVVREKLHLTCDTTCKIIDSVPTADVKPVVRGEWRKDEYGSFIKICSACKRKPLALYIGEPYYSDFCPHCGAEMRGDKNA